MKIDFYRYSEHVEVHSISELILSETDLSIFRGKDIYRIKDYTKNLICNFYVAYKTKKCVAIPRKKAYYSDQSNFAFGKISFRFFLFVLDILVAYKPHLPLD